MSQIVMFVEIAGVLTGGILATALVVWITDPKPRPARRAHPIPIDSRVQEILPARIRAGISLGVPAAPELNYERTPETGLGLGHEERWMPTADL